MPTQLTSATTDLELIPNEIHEKVNYFAKKYNVSADKMHATENKIRIHFGNDADLMIEIARAESEMGKNPYNPEWHYDRAGNKVCQGSYGLFQIACVNYNGNSEDLFNDELNIEIAKKVLSSQGINAWGVCRTKVNCK
jgi:hypothetical protein